MAIHYLIANLNNENTAFAVCVWAISMHLPNAQRLYFLICGDFHQHAASIYPVATHSQKPPRFSDFLKQKSRGNHHAIGFYFVKSEQD